MIEKNYSRALFEIANEEKILKDIKKELDLLNNYALNDYHFTSFIESKRVLISDKINLIKKIITIDLLINFIFLLLRKNRINNIKVIIENFLELYYKKKNIIYIEIILANDVDDNFLDDIKTILENKFHKKVILKNIIDENIIGGFIIKNKNFIIDLSIYNRLKQLKFLLLNK
ncbi:MAG: ATP synthase F1 subunit delta [Clostridiales bacterium]|jgi:F-type H+-transporting ATPase subunit delta|nr:ATP synthase F1 subunit delta [Clostridiales bacterium]